MDPAFYNFEYTESYVKSNDTGEINNNTVNGNLDDDLKVHKIEFLMLVISETMYIIILLKSLIRYFKTRDWHFWFLITASSFALMNNSSDIIYRIRAPLGFIDCTGFFIYFFYFSATLNWVPISFYQICRLYRITINYYKKDWLKKIIFVCTFFSILYSTSYFMNLIHYRGNSSKFGGCVVNNDANIIFYVEIFDIIDTSVSLLIVIITLFISLKNLKNYKLRHFKIKAVLDNNVIIFVILLVSKMVFYYIINAYSKKPGGDIWWDSLSVIVLWCAYALLNLKPKLNEKLEQNNMMNYNRKNNNYLRDLSNLAMNNRSESSRNKFQYYYNRNSKGELNFPSLMNKDELMKMNNDNNVFNFRSNQNFKNYNNFNNLKNNKYQDFQNNYSSVSNRSNTSNINMNVNMGSGSMTFNVNEMSSIDRKSVV